MALPTACAVWVVFSPEDPARYVSIIDGLAVPPTWEEVHADTQRDFIMGTRADRIFLIDADPEDAVLTVKEVVQASGFMVHTRFATWDWCDPHPLDASLVPCPPKKTEDCRSDFDGGPVTCHLYAYRNLPSDPEHLERLFIGLHPRGTILDYRVGSERRYVGDPNHSLVSIRADLSVPRFFWSSPTPSPN